MNSAQQFDNPILIHTHLCAASADEAIRIVAKPLLDEKLVREDFADHVIAREQSFPTGLGFPEGGVAIPHTDSQYVNHTGFSIGVFDLPVTFHDMGAPKNQVPVRIVIVLAVAEAHLQVTVLQHLIEVLQQPGCIKDICEVQSEVKIVESFHGLSSNVTTDTAKLG